MIGYLAKSPKFGSALKLTASGLIGYITGKFSYQGKCREKILALENSPLADAIRRRGGSGFIPSMFVKLDIQNINDKTVLFFKYENLVSDQHQQIP